MNTAILKVPLVYRYPVLAVLYSLLDCKTLRFSGLILITIPTNSIIIPVQKATGSA